MNSDFLHNLYLVFFYRLSFLLVVLVASIVINVLYLKRIRKNLYLDGAGRRRQRISDFETRKKNCFGEAIVGLIGIILAFFIWALPPCKDALCEDVVEVEALYCRNEKDLRSGIPNIGGDIWIRVGNDTFSLELYPGFSDADFPVGTYRAIVCYGANSKILLSVNVLEVE